MLDRIGIGWRPELAAGILSHLDRIDVVEVIADDYFRCSRRGLAALRTLGAQVPVVLHGVGMGLASCAPADERRLAGMARVVDAVAPEIWSEHLAFVRGGGLEIGHLAAPPRDPATLAGTAANVERARRVVGMAPLLENVATLVDPPASTYDEGEWIGAFLGATSCDLLLDLHNLHANAVNFGWEASSLLRRLPPHRIAAIHLAGGRRLAGGRVLDDHLHDPPAEVYALLAEVAARATRPLTVILERDGHYPPMAELLSQLDRARAAVTGGRAQQAAAR